MTKRLRQLIFLPAIAMLAGITSSCDEDTAVCPQAPTVEAILKWTGDYAVDGCGYILQIGDTDYKPENEATIPDSFKQTSSTAVEVRVLDNHKTIKTCQAVIDMNSIKILEIQRK